MDMKSDCSLRIEDLLHRVDSLKEAIGAAPLSEGERQELLASLRAEIVDLYGPSRDEVPRRPELIAGDGYHPSDAGYARWAELMWTGVQRRLGRSG